MGLTATTTNLSYARNEYIKVGVSFIFDRVGDMIYYTLANNDIAMTLTNILAMGAQGTGVALTTVSPFAVEIHAKPVTALTAGTTGLSAGIRCRYEVGKAQTNQISIVAIDARLRPKFAMADGVHAGINAGIESDAVAYTGTARTQRCGGHFYIEMATGTTIASGWLTGVTIDSSVHGAVDVSSCTFAGLRIKVSTSKEPWTHGIYISDAVTAITITGATTAISADSPIATTSASTGAVSVTATQTSATPGTIRGIYSKETTHSSMTSGNVVGVRGEVTVGGTVSTGVYLYGTQGKLIGGSNTITAGNGMVCGIYGQLDVSGTTIASGWVSAIHADIYGANSGSIDINLISATHAGGGVINALLSLFGKSDYVFDISSNTHDNVATTGTVTTDDGYIKVLIDGSTRYIGLGSAVA